MSGQIKRSLGIAKFSDVITLGNNLSKNIKDALTLQLHNGSGALYNELAKLMGYDIQDAARMVVFQEYIKDFELLEEIPLVTSGGFMKADILLVKRNATGTGIADAIIIENKLSASTAFTPRQKEGFSGIINGNLNMKVKYDVDEFQIFANDIVPVSKDKIFKFSDGGTDNIANVIGSKIISTK